MKGFILHPTYRVKKDKVFVQLYGKLENGESFLAELPYKPYFFIKREDLKKALEIRNLEWEETDFKDFYQNKVVKLYTKIPREVGELRKIFEKNGIECYEADVRFAMRFLIDKDIRGFLDIEGSYEKGKRVSRIYKNPKIKSSKPFDVKLKILSLDIEVSEEDGRIVGIALYPYESYLLSEVEGAKSFSSEWEMLSYFRKRVLELDPDVIIGWNVIDFDFDYLSKRFEKFKIPFDIGREKGEVRFRSETSFIRASRVKIEGRIVLDAMHLMRDFFIRLEDYKLDTASRNILGEGKIEVEKDIDKLLSENPKLLSEYNWRDAELVYKIVEKKKLIDLSVTMSQITGMKLDRVKASIASLDSLYLREAKRRKIVCPSVSRTGKKRVTGGLVKKPKFGIYDFVLVFDFKSLYPSIIATLNIDPITFGEGDIVAPNGARFSRKKSILPEIILELLKKREKAKTFEEDYAIKIVMNSFFGVLGNPNCRFYNSLIANAITGFGRYFLELTSKKIEEMGYEVIYGDTDSLFVLIDVKSKKEAERIGKMIEREINEFYEKFVAENYKRPNYLKLEFEKLYEKFYLPRQRHLQEGAKKRYAGLMDKEVDVVGLEYVRRDWTDLAKEFQYNLLKKVFLRDDYEEYIREFVSKLKMGELDNLLVYKKGVRKDLRDYTKTTPPHVKAARKLSKFRDRIIYYVMTKSGPEPLEERHSSIDYSHYIEKQLKPIANSVLMFYGKDFDDVLEGKKQTSLMDYF